LLDCNKSGLNSDQPSTSLISVVKIDETLHTPRSVGSKPEIIPTIMSSIWTFTRKFLTRSFPSASWARLCQGAKLVLHPTEISETFLKVLRLFRLSLDVNWYPPSTNTCWSWSWVSRNEKWNRERAHLKEISNTTDGKIERREEGMVLLQRATNHHLRRGSLNDNESDGKEKDLWNRKSHRRGSRQE